MADIIAKLKGPANAEGVRSDIHLITSTDEVILDNGKSLTSKVVELEDAADNARSRMYEISDSVTARVEQLTETREAGDSDIEYQCEDSEFQLERIKDTMEGNFSLDEEKPTTFHKKVWLPPVPPDTDEHPHRPYQPGGDYKPDPSLPNGRIEGGPTTGERTRAYIAYLADLPYDGSLGPDYSIDMFEFLYNIDDDASVNFGSFKSSVARSRIISYDLDTGLASYDEGGIEKIYPMKIVDDYDKYLKYFGFPYPSTASYYFKAYVKLDTHGVATLLDIHTFDKETGRRINSPVINYNGSPISNPQTQFAALIRSQNLAVFRCGSGVTFDEFYAMILPVTYADEE